MRSEAGLRTSDKERIRRARLMKEQEADDVGANPGGVHLELWQDENSTNPRRTWALTIEDDYRGHLGDHTARIRIDDEMAGFLRRAFGPGPEEVND